MYEPQADRATGRDEEAEHLLSERYEDDSLESSQHDVANSSDTVHAVSQRNDYVLDPAWNAYAKPQKRIYDWTITDVELNPDGVFRPMVVINGQFPGPMIECNEGDTIVVNVRNEAVNATSIHWHGMYQNGTNWMDGTVGVTQCPIAPGAAYTYEFSTQGQWGTYWYHGHRGVQASDGLLGPLIIHSKDEIQHLKYDTDRVVMVQDHYYNTSNELLMDYLKPNQENAEPVPDSALINGRNVRDCALLPNRICDSSMATLPTMVLEEGKKHRLRFINVGAFAEFQVQIDEHEFAVTEVDGTDVIPAYFHRLNILPAQRYSIVVDASVTTQSAYWLRARMVTHCFAEENEEMEAEVRAIVQYSATELHDIEPKSRDWPEVVEVTCHDMNTTELHPAIPVAAPSDVNDVIHLRSNFEIGNWKLSRGFFNQSSWRASSNSSSLSRFISGVKTGNGAYTSSLYRSFGINDEVFDPSSELTYQTTGIQTVDILISNFDDGSHPMHLHGYKFWVLASGIGYPPENLYDPGVLDLSNPLRRDTASIEAYGWILLRLKADNAGMWAFHCHITWHAEAGLMMQFLTRADIVSMWSIPNESENLCMMAGLEKGERPHDEIWFGNRPGV
ncbi:multicopper oxidase [Pseudovirgaria hyperparasitica]|uniref:Multicopper oxidase n=1 Tax=Pseudovirgaria hyperparasitica TaxID=470096 RepID=A0A6A6VZA8_9PEZI|nr:multicopper oxidase [Pseudovirgaria hyperparasitica]KAF2755020.1 multicopper oxidase [Pseudovirgaria hyperparasitica]